MLTIIVLLVNYLIAFTEAAPTNKTLSLRNLLRRSEVLYDNFDPQNPADVGFKVQLQSAWSNSLDLMEATVNTGFDNQIFSHYFDPADKDTVSRVFNGMFGGDSNRGSPNLGSITIDNHDFKNECVGNGEFLCYLDNVYQLGGRQPLAVSARIHCCMAERTSKMPEVSGSNGITCDSLGDFVSYKMSTLSSALLHEFTHFDIIGGENIVTDLKDFPKHIGDMGIVRDDTEPTIYGKQPNGYGPFAVRNLPKQLATRNADSYTWLALENFWTAKCERGFTAPRKEGDQSVPQYCGGNEDNQDTARCVIM